MPYRLTAAATAHGHGTTIDGVGRCSEARRPRQNDALWTRVLLAMVDLLVGASGALSQWVVLSAPDEHPW